MVNNSGQYSQLMKSNKSDKYNYSNKYEAPVPPPNPISYGHYNEI